MFDDLRAETLAANLRLVTERLVRLTWGNVGVRSGDGRHVAIKPSGMPYDSMTVDDIVVLALDGTIVEGERRPSSDTPTHLELFRAFPEIGAVVHVHSAHTVAFAQARRAVRALGTTHADHFAGDVTVTRPLTADEVANEYEANTGRVIVDHLQQRAAGPLDVPAVLVAGHGPFVWGPSSAAAVDNTVALEECARSAELTARIDPDGPRLEPWVLDAHHRRKHGPDAYYGQADPNGAPE